MNDAGKESISAGQLAILYVSFMTGSSIIYIPNPMIGFAGNMAWLSLIVSALLSMLVLFFVLYLFRCFPDSSYPEYLRLIYGKWISALFLIPLMLMLYLMLSYIVLGIGNFFVNTMMVETPMYVFHALTLITAAYTVYAGIEVMGRMFFPLVGSIMIFVTLTFCLAFTVSRPETLLPLFSEGLKPILHGVYFSFGFPFAELFLFSVLLPFVWKEERPQVGKWMYAMTAFSAVFLLITVIVTILTLGPLAGDRKFSLFSVARLIQFGHFLVGIESVVGIVLVAGSFMKAAVVLFILNYVTSRFFSLNDEKFVLPAITFTAFLLSVTMFQMESEFSLSVNEVWPLITMIVGVGPLILTAFVTFVKRRLLRRN